MATKVAIAQLRDNALERLTASMAAISSALGVEPADLPTFDRDRDYLHATQLDGIADWADGVVEALKAQPEPEGSEDGRPSNQKKASPRRDG